MSGDIEAGGFIPPGLPSPAPSSVSDLSSIAGGGSGLPTQRRHGLAPGSQKESLFISHVDQKISRINRRYAKKHTRPGDDGKGELKGYQSFKEVAKDVDPLLDIPYFLSLAVIVLTFMPSFAAAPRSMLRLLNKLDMAFASLIQGKDLDTGETLSGFESGRRVNATEKVRMKATVERTRITVIEIMNKDEFEPENEDEDSSTGNEDPFDVEDSTDVNMDVARVYDRTLVELGDTLGGPTIGIPEA
ncbi:MAG: hypothetical protein M1831_003438 [Alyxoria varia]|nr:MAG: hypothetical protein M1831_003438 [Alyxoria varia]